MYGLKTLEKCGDGKRFHLAENGHWTDFHSQTPQGKYMVFSSKGEAGNAIKEYPYPDRSVTVRVVELE